jgi:hypothetical protein
LDDDDGGGGGVGVGGRQEVHMDTAQLLSSFECFRLTGSSRLLVA